MSNNRNFKFAAFLMLVVALFTIGAVVAFASDDLGGGGGSLRPVVSAQAQDIFTVNEDALAEFISPDSSLIMLYEPVNGADTIGASDLVTAAENLLGADDVGETLGDWLVETESGTYRVRLVALLPSA